MPVSPSVLLLAVGLAGIAVALKAGRARSAAAVAAVGGIAALSLLPYLSAVRAARDWGALVRYRSGFPALWRSLEQALGAGSTVIVALWLALGAFVVLHALVRLARPGTARKTAAVADSSGRPPDPALFGGLTVLLSAVLFLGFLNATRLVSAPWYYVPALGLWAAAIGGTFGRPSLARESGARRAAPWHALIPVGALGLALVLSWPGLGASLRMRQTNVDLIARHLEAKAEAGDLVVVNPWYLGVSFQHYYRGAARWTTIPPLEDHTLHRYDLLKRSMQGSDPIAGVLAAIDSTLEAGHHVWLLGGLALPPAREAAPASPSAADGAALDGVRASAYLNAWALQEGAELRLHATNAMPVELAPAGSVSPLEDEPLIEVSGANAPLR